MKYFLTILLFSLMFTTTAKATLWERDGGFIYDDVNDITWLQDANYPKTIGYSAAHSTGYMTWQQATTWAAALELGDSTDWRLPTSGEVQGFVADGELGYLYYTGLGNEAWDTSFTSSFVDGYGNTVSFNNIQRLGYWTSTSATYGTNYKWVFNFSNGSSDYVLKDGAPKYAWAVHDGDISPSYFLLAENGAKLLLETGDKLLVEY